MLAPINSPTPIRPIGLSTPPMPQDICVGVPSCAPLVQHELLKSVREQIPHAYTRAGQELGLTISRTQELIDKRVEIISAARAIKLARIIAYEPNARDVFGETGHNLFCAINRELPRLIKATVRHLPRRLRIRLAVALTKQIAHSFAGSINQIIVQPGDEGVKLWVLDGVFSDRLDTLGCAHTYYRNVFETMLQQLAFVDCEVNEVRRSRVRLNQCTFEIVWEA
jgi:hypothetical protein